MAVTFRFLQAAAVSVVFLSLCVHAAETPLVALSSVLKRANAVSAPASDRGGGANPIASDIGSRVDAGGAANVAAAASALPMSPPHDTYRASEGLSDSSAQAFILFSETAKSGLQSALDGSEWALRNRQVVFRNAATESWQIVYTPATPLASEQKKRLIQ